MSTLWPHLTAMPLFWLGLTIGVFAFAQFLGQKAKGAVWANPVLISIAAIILLLEATGTSYTTFFRGAEAIHLALGPATVALGVPLWRSRKLVMQNRRAVLAALGVGAPVGALSAWGIATLTGATPSMALTLIPKSVTAGIAVGVADAIGAEAALAGVLVITTGVVGAAIAVPLLKWLKIEDPAARGFAVGLAAHGIGTARALQLGAVLGAFAGLGMALNGIVTAVMVPLFFALFVG